MLPRFQVRSAHPPTPVVKTACFLLLALLPASAADDKGASDLPGGPGKDLTARICLDCHDSGNFRRKRFTSDDWSDSVADMVDRGAKATPAEIDAVVAYLATNFGPDSPVRINTAPFAEIKFVLGFTVAETTALLQYRQKFGPLKGFPDLLKVPGIDPAKAASRKPQIAF